MSKVDQIRKVLDRSYFDSPNTVYIAIGTLAGVVMWVIGQVEYGFDVPPTWIIVATAVGVAGVAYGIDGCLTSLFQWTYEKA